MSQVFLIRRVLLHFYMLWEIDGETHAFPVWQSIQQNENLMEEKHLYFGENMVTNFPDSPHTKGFDVFYHVVETDGKPFAFPMW